MFDSGEGFLRHKAYATWPASLRGRHVANRPPKGKLTDYVAILENRQRVRHRRVYPSKLLVVALAHRALCEERRAGPDGASAGPAGRRDGLRDPARVWACTGGPRLRHSHARYHALPHWRRCPAGTVE